MDPQLLKTIVVCASVLGIFGVPLVMAFLVHQQKMTELLARGSGNEELARRLESIEQRLAALEPRVATLILEQDDKQSRKVIGSSDETDLLRQRSS